MTRRLRLAGTVPKWGGARNRADRASDALTLEQAAGIIEAARFASHIGLPFNRHVTIHWELAGVSENRAVSMTGAYLKLARQWLQKRGERFAYAWVRENDCGDGSKGSHVHILMHVRPEIAWDFTSMQRRWLKRVTGKPYRVDTIRTARIGGSLRAATTVPAVHQVNLEAVVSYVIKGACPKARRALRLERSEAGGRVIGKRAGWSQNVGKAVRLKAGWVDLLS